MRAYTGASVGLATPALMRLAESTHQVGAARAFLEKTWEDHRVHGVAKQYPTAETLTAWRTNQAYAVKMCIEAVDRLFSVAGASAWFDGNELQRLFRDSHMTGAHAYTDYDVCSQILGTLHHGHGTRSYDDLRHFSSKTAHGGVARVRLASQR